MYTYNYIYNYRYSPDWRQLWAYNTHEITGVAQDNYLKGVIYP